MTSNDLLSSFLTSRGSSNIFQIIMNQKHGRMILLFSFFSEIREMTLNHLRLKWPQRSEQKFLISDRERSIKPSYTLQVSSFNSEGGDSYPTAPCMLVILVFILFSGRLLSRIVHLVRRDPIIWYLMGSRPDMLKSGLGSQVWSRIGPWIFTQDQTQDLVKSKNEPKT